MTDHLKTTVIGGVMTLTISRPDKKNALTGAMYDAMSEGLLRSESDPAIKAVVFQGDGDSFTAGNDLADFRAQSTADDTGESPAFRFIGRLGCATKPLIAAVQGNAVGLGRRCSCIVTWFISRTIAGSLRHSLIWRSCRRLHRVGCCQCGLVM